MRKRIENWLPVCFLPLGQKQEKSFFFFRLYCGLDICISFFILVDCVGKQPTIDFRMTPFYRRSFSRHESMVLTATSRDDMFHLAKVAQHFSKLHILLVIFFLCIC